MLGQIVTEERDVERADGDRDLRDLTDQGAEAMPQGDAAGRDPEEDEAVGASIRLEDLVRDPGQRS